MYFCLYPFPLIESTCVTWSVMGLKGNFMTNLPATTEVKANNFICIWVSNNCRIIYLETTIRNTLKNKKDCGTIVKILIETFCANIQISQCHLSRSQKFQIMKNNKYLIWKFSNNVNIMWWCYVDELFVLYSTWFEHS